MGLTPVEFATTTLEGLLAHLEALAEMGVPVHVPAQLVDSCRKIVGLAEASVGKANADHGVPMQEVGEVLARKMEEVGLPESPAESGIRWSGPHPRRTGGRSRRIRDAVLDAIRPGEEVTAGVIVERLEAADIRANRDTVSNELARWTHEGLLERPARGTYRRDTLTITDPARDHEPLAAEERPNDQEGMGGDAAIRAEGAVM